MSEHTEHEERLARILYEATSGTHRNGPGWEHLHAKGLWLADAARILGDYQQEFFAALAPVVPAQPSMEEGL